MTQWPANMSYLYLIFVWSMASRYGVWKYLLEDVIRKCFTGMINLQVDAPRRAAGGLQFEYGRE